MLFSPLFADEKQIKMVVRSLLEKGVHVIRNWFILGQQLGLSLSTLERIKLKHREDSEKCIGKMVHWWIRRKDHVSEKGGANWRTLVAGLRKLGEKKVADVFEKEHLPMDVRVSPRCSLLSTSI